MVPTRPTLAGALPIALSLAALTHPASAAPLLPGPGDAAHDTELAAKADGIERQIHGLLTLPLGWGLEAFVDDPAARAAVDAFAASAEHDFEASTGFHPYEVITRYEEHGDLGMFGGVQVAGDAFRYAILRDAGAPQERVERARAELVAALRGLHWYTLVTGVPGAMARGLRRAIPDPGDPPLPEPAPETTPLFDAQGAPLPTDKTATWRDDQSGELPFLVWLDDTSKDQVDGYVFALGAVYDVVVDDPAIPADLVATLVEDARAIGHRLMEKVEVVPDGFIDLVLVDADGRPTKHHDLSAEEVTPGVLLDEPLNGFNAWMALAVIRTLYHVTGDEPIGRFYRELVELRDYPVVARDTIAIMYTGENTNYSNVNMAFVAAWGLLRYESDPELAAFYREILEEQLYAPGVDREARGLGQAFFDFVYAGFRTGGAFGPGEIAVAEGIRTLSAHSGAPYWDDPVVHCDEVELASGDCVAEDGTPLPLASGTGWNGGDVAVDPLPPHLRPPSNFAWRSDPHAVNGGGSTRLNPGGDFHAAYWMGRFLERTADGHDNVSPRARPLPPPLAATPAGEAGGCSCGSAGTGSAPGWRFGAALAAAWLVRRRRRTR